MLSEMAFCAFEQSSKPKSIILKIMLKLTVLLENFDLYYLSNLISVFSQEVVRIAIY